MCHSMHRIYISRGLMDANIAIYGTAHDCYNELDDYAKKDAYKISVRYSKHLDTHAQSSQHNLRPVTLSVDYLKCETNYNLHTFHPIEF